MCAALVFLARRSARAIVTPMRRIATVADALANGDRDSRVTVTGRDEIAQVGAAFNTMVDGLARQDAQIATAQAEREQHLTERVEHERIAEQRLRERAQSAIDETAHSVSAELQQLSTQVDVVRQGAATIDERVSATVEVINGVTEHARTADRVVAELQASLREVDGMTRLIANVADQTKLLALNATIEAARAGDAGRGFTVVADEVKELAMETGRSTEQITTTINTLNTHSKAVAVAIAAMSSGITDVGDASGVLRHVAEQQFSVVAALDAQVGETRERVESMSSVTTQLERRRHQRYPVEGPAKLTLDGRTLTATTVDLSQGGLRCHVETAGIHVGQSGTASLHLDGHDVTVHVNVVDAGTESGVGEVGMSLDGTPDGRPGRDPQLPQPPALVPRVWPGRGRVSADEHHVERAGAVDALDPVEFDVAGGARATDPGERGERPGRVDPRDRVGNIGEHLFGPHDDEQVVRHQAERAPPLAGTGVEHDRAGLGDGERAGGDRAVGGVQLGRGERLAQDVDAR